MSSVPPLQKYSSLKKCVICKKEYTEMTYAPFCSKRCKLIDLHRWLDGSYSVPTNEKEEE
ncbi:MAG: DNA gyrase inhibitor YacG [Alphaproteobacteria bacterium]|nr:MAG: DNA gyrase inhibitor YacG [Alphaproteobacteria bacterium]